MKIRKEVIRTGDHTYLDESGNPAVLKTTKDKIEHYFQNGLDMLKTGLPIPIPLEHQPSATPMNAMDKAADRVRHNAGEVVGFERDTIKDEKTGADIHRVMSILDIKDNQIGEQVKNGSIRWVSPHITSFVDGKGKEWNDVIAHVALTSRPRIYEQEPFESVAMSFSQLVPGAKLLKKGFDLPNAGRLKPDGKPEFPVAFSLLTSKKKKSVKLGVEAKEKIKEDIKEDIDDDDDDAEMVDSDLETDSDIGDGSSGGDPLASEISKDPAMGNDAGDVSFEELIPHLLEMHGIHVPAGGKGKEFLKALVQGLLISAKTMAATDGGADDSVLGDTSVADQAADQEKKKGPIVQESPPMYMSMTVADVQKIKDPKDRQTAEAFLSLRQEMERKNVIAEALQKNLLADATAQRQSRIERIAGKLPVAARDKFLGEMRKPSAQLSLVKSGESIGKIHDPMDVMLETFEQSIPDLPAMLKSGVKLSEQDHPPDSTVTDKRAQEIADEQLKRINPYKQQDATAACMDSLLSLLENRKTA